MNEQLRYRAAEQIGVNYPERTIELIVMPYEKETVVGPPGPDGDRGVRAAARSTGSSAGPTGCGSTATTMSSAPAGGPLAFYPERPEGLVAKVRIAQTELGDETLTLADEDMLDASAGFLPMAGGEQWLTRAKCRLTKCWLGHIAMTPDPAYETAKVLAVRHTDPPAEEIAATPNLDLLRQWDLEDRYPELRT